MFSCNADSQIIVFLKLRTAIFGIIQTERVRPERKLKKIVQSFKDYFPIFEKRKKGRIFRLCGYQKRCLNVQINMYTIIIMLYIIII
jgi:hypothetical protein